MSYQFTNLPLQLKQIGLPVFVQVTLLFFSFCASGNAQKLDTTGVSLLYAQAEYNRAIQQFESAIAHYRKADSLYNMAADTQGHAFCLLYSGYCHYGLSQKAEAEKNYQKVASLLQASTVPSANYLLAVANCYLANVSLDKGAYEEAALQCEKGIAYYQKQPRKDADLAGMLYTQMAKSFNRRQMVLEALGFARKAVAIYEQAGLDTKYSYEAYFYLGTLYMTTSNIDSCMLYYGKMEQWLDTLPIDLLPKSAPFLYCNTAILYELKGDYDKSIEYSVKGIGIAEKRRDKCEEFHVVAYTNVGAFYMQMNNKEQAMPYLQKALTLIDSVDYIRENYKSWVWNTIGECYAQHGDKDQAHIYWEKALQEGRTSGSVETQVDTYTAMAGTAVLERNYEEALTYYEKIVRIIENAEGTHAFLLAKHHGNMASCLNKLKRYDEALTYNEKVLKVQYPTGNHFQDPNHPPRSNELRMIEDLPVTLSEKAYALLGKWKLQPTQLIMLDSAWKVSEQALRATEYFRRNYQHSGAESYEWILRIHEVYDFSIEIARQIALSRKNTITLETAFQLADQSRAILMEESARNAHARQFAGLPNELLEQEQLLRSQIVLYESTAYEQETPQDPSATHQIDSILFDLRRRQERLIRRFEQEYPKYYSLRYDSRPIDITKLRQQLSPDAALVEYLLNEQENTLYIFVVDRAHGVRLHAQPWSEAIAKQILQLHQRTQSVLLQRKAIRELFIAESHALYGQLIQPIASYLEGKKQLIIVAEGDLHYLPFELLVESPDLNPFEQLPYLIRRYNISYQYSAALYLRNAIASKHTTKYKATNGQILAFAPVFGSESDPETIALRNRSTMDTTLRAATADGAHFQPLPYSEQEVRNIAALFSKQRTTLLMRQDANEANLKAALEKPHRMIHLSTHSFANRSRPKFSGIACTQPIDNNPGDEDGILHANEIYNLPLAADLVVLSSCESGVGKSGGGEGLLGLNRAFSYAGVPNVVYSLWKVNDKVTSELMVAFYKEMLAGKTYAAALRAAKLKMLENPITASPNFWSGFLLMGR